MASYPMNSTATGGSRTAEASTSSPGSSSARRSSCFRCTYLLLRCDGVYPCCDHCAAAADDAVCSFEKELAAASGSAPRGAAVQGSATARASISLPDSPPHSSPLSSIPLPIQTATASSSSLAGLTTLSSSAAAAEERESNPAQASLLPEASTSSHAQTVPQEAAATAATAPISRDARYNHDNIEQAQPDEELLEAGHVRNWPRLPSDSASSSHSQNDAPQLDGQEAEERLPPPMHDIRHRHRRPPPRPREIDSHLHNTSKATSSRTRSVYEHVGYRRSPSPYVPEPEEEMATYRIGCVDLMPEDMENLLVTFYHYSFHLNLPMPPASIRRRLNYPPEHPHALPKPLLHAILTFAALFHQRQEPRMTGEQHTSMILQVNEELSYPAFWREKPLDYILTVTVLGRTLLLLGHTREAAHLAAGAVRSATLLNLHRLARMPVSMCISPQQPHVPVLPTATDGEELGQRIRLWFCVSTLNCEAVVAIGKICSMTESLCIDMNAILPTCHPPDSSKAPFRLPRDATLEMRTASAALYCRAHCLLARAQIGVLLPGTSTFSDEFQSLDMALQKLWMSLPSVDSCIPPPSKNTREIGASADTPECARLPTLELAHTLAIAHGYINASVLLMNESLLGIQNTSARLGSLRAARRLAETVTSTELVPAEALHGSFKMLVLVASRAFARELASNSAGGSSELESARMLAPSYLDVLRTRLHSLSQVQ